MANEPDEPEDGHPHTLDGDDHEDVDDRRGGSPRIIHEVIRQEGSEELARPATSLILSGIAAGVAINASILGRTYFRVHLPDAPWRHLVESIGYTFGFLIVILGRLQLFTESTVTPVLPVATAPTWRNLGLLMRLWGLVFAANMIGTFAVALVLAHTAILSGEDMRALMAISQELLAADAWRTFLLGVPAGFMMAAIAWTLPNARPASFWVIVTFIYLIALAGFSHVIGAATEAWMLALTGEISWGSAWLDLILPALAGNVLGGTGLFALLAHGQVASEISD